MIYYNGYIGQIHYNGNAIRRVYSCGGNLVWSRFNKLIATYNDSSKNYVFCNDSPILTENEVKTNGYEYSAMTNAVIENCVTSIGENAFSGCTNLSSCTMPNTITNIGNSAFVKCSGLTSIDIPSGVTSIGVYAFGSCSGITSATIPNTVTTIDNGAFFFNVSLKSINIPDSVTSINDDTFYECKSLSSCTIPNTVTSIGKFAFTGCTSLTGITIPDSVTSIGNKAFCNCSGMTNLTIGSGVTTIGNEAFRTCNSLTNIDIPDSVTTIGDSAFYFCANLTSVTIGSGITSIGSDAFYGSTHLQSITCNAITPPTLGNVAFNNTNDCPIYVPCQSLEAYKTAWSEYESRIQCVTPPTPTGGTKFSAIYNDSSSYSVDCDGNTTLTTGTTRYGGFSKYSGMTSAVIGDCVTTIGDSVFRECISLTSVTIPNTVTSIRGESFHLCASLTSVGTQGSGASVEIPSGVTAFTYGEEFSYCTGLTDVTIGDQITALSNDMFAHCYSLTSVTIGSGVTVIEHAAFANCTGLTSITINATTPPTVSSSQESDWKAFDNTNNCPIYCPDASVSLYQNAYGWRLYFDRIKPISEKP